MTPADLFLCLVGLPAALGWLGFRLECEHNRRHREVGVLEWRRTRR